MVWTRSWASVWTRSWACSWVCVWASSLVCVWAPRWVRVRACVRTGGVRSVGGGVGS